METARKRNINTVTTTLSRSVRSSSGVPSLGICVYTLAPPRTRRIRVSTYTTNATATVLRYCFECFTTIARFVVSPRSVPAAIPLDAPARNLSSFLSLFPLFPLAWLLCVVTRIRTRASRASLLDKARFLLCPFSPSLFLLIYSILSFYLLIILPRQIVRFAYFLYLSICIPNDFIKRLLSFSRDAFRGIP